MSLLRNRGRGAALTPPAPLLPEGEGGTAAPLLPRSGGKGQGMGAALQHTPIFGYRDYIIELEREKTYANIRTPYF